MKKIGLLLCSIIGIVLFNSCASLAADHGYFPAGQEPTNGFATINVKPYLSVTHIDNTPVDSSLNMYRPEVFTIEPGLHTFTIKYNDGYKWNTQDLLAKVEKDKTYTVTYKIGSSGSAVRIYYHLIDSETSKAVELDKNALAGKAKNVISQFINAVLNPTMKGTDKTVIEENDEYILTSLPNMKYELLNKKTNAVQKGYRGFETDFRLFKGTVYLYETDSVSSIEEFLKTNFKTDSKIIFEVTDCDSKTVTYTYVKPEELAGKTIKFDIRVKD